MDLQPFKEYQPTVFDRKGTAFLPERQEWLVVVGRTRDSGPLEQSNFEVALRELGGEGPDVEVHRFRHWGCGWLEIILVRPDTEVHQIAKNLVAALTDYPVLDDEDCSRREYESALENWRLLDVRERAALCVRYGVSKFAARHEDKIPNEVLEYFSE